MGQLNKRKKLLLLISVLALLTLVVGVVAWADSSGPNFSNQSPALDSTINVANPKISMHVEDVDGINDSSRKFYLNGALKTSTIIHPYTWEEDPVTWQMVKVYDPNQADITYQASGLPDGTNTVKIELKDKLANTSIYQWSFNVVVPPTATSFTPADGGLVTNSKPIISAVLKDSNGTIEPNSIVLTVNGIQRAHTFNTTTGLVSFTPTEALPSGTCSVTLAAADQGGNPVNASWSFNIAVGPTITNLYPTRGATINESKPTISAVIADANGTIDPNSVVMKLGNTNVPSTFDSSTGVASYTPPTALAAGNYTVTLAAGDNDGDLVEETWEFTIAIDNVGPVFTNLEPADGATILVNNYLIKVNAADENELDKNSLVAKLDGNVVPATISFPSIWVEDANYNMIKVDDLTQGTISYQADGLDFGPHSLEIFIKDKLGAESISSTNFFVDQSAVKPVISNLVPADGLVKTLKPTIGADITGTSAITKEGIRLLVDGQSISDFSFTSTGTNSGRVSYTPPTNLTNESMHYITLTATDSRAISTTEEWSFYTTDFVEMDGILSPQECLLCHSVEKHPVDQCASCHTGATRACLSCHTEHDPDVITTYRNNECFTCHGPNGYIAGWCEGHNVESAHTLSSSCAGECHANSLTREHQIRTDDSGTAYNCSTCHSNTNAAIITALITPSKSCDSCHDKAHNINFVEKVPVDIPLHSSFLWSAPQKALIWKGESWLPLDYADTGGKMVISNRHDTSIMDTATALNYYKTEMINKGWVLASEEPSTDHYFYLTFTKVNRVCTVIWYTDQTHTGTNPLPAGGRFEILYK